MALEKVFTKKEWHDDAPPYIDEVEMNARDDAMDQMDDRIISLDQRLADIEENGSGGSGGGAEAVDYGSGKQQVGILNNRAIYEELLSVDQITSTETVISPDASYYKLLSASGAADHEISGTETDTQRIALPYSMGQEFVQIMEDRRIKTSRKIVLRTDSVDYSNVNIALKYLGKLQISNPCTWADGTIEEISTLLEAHYDGDFNIWDVWNVGDERDIVTSDIPAVKQAALSGTLDCTAESGRPNKLILLNPGGKTLADGVTECAYVVGLDTGYTGQPWLYDVPRNIAGWSTDPMRYYYNQYLYAAIPDGERSLLKQFINKQTEAAGSNVYEVKQSIDYTSPPDEVEIFGAFNNSNEYEGGVQFDFYKTNSPQKFKLLSGGTLRPMAYSLRSQSNKSWYRLVIRSDGTIGTGDMKYRDYGPVQIMVI